MATNLVPRLSNSEAATKGSRVLQHTKADFKSGQSTSTLGISDLIESTFDSFTESTIGSVTAWNLFRFQLKCLVHHSFVGEFSN